jgi:hypothetical protein
MKSQSELFRLYRELTGKTTYVPKEENTDVVGYQQSAVKYYYGMRAD